MKKWILIGLVVFFLLAAMTSDQSTPASPSSESADSADTSTEEINYENYDEVAGRLSAAVSFEYSDSRVAAWLENPGRAFIESYVYFEEDLSDTTIMGIDMELLEGTDNPIRFEGADWMAAAGVQRTGTVWIAGGRPSALAGEASSERDWQFRQLGTSLQPNTWYKLRTVANFDTLQFESFTVEGPGVSRTFDISDIQLDYPNYMPFDGRSLTHYVWTIDGTAIGGSKNRSSSAYFDDISYGIYRDGREITIHTDTVERFGTSFSELPLKMSWGTILLEGFEERVWYQERDEALTRPIEKTFARSGGKVIEADAEVREISLEVWMAE
jgi:hypothetical protein